MIPLEPRPKLNEGNTLLLCSGVSIPWNPSTQAPEDTSGLGYSLWEDWRARDIMAGGTGTPDPWQAPPAAVPDTITDVQFFSALTRAPYEIVDEMEALEAVKSGDLPEALDNFVENLPAEQQFNARMYLSGSTTLSRSYFVIQKLRNYLGWTQQELEDFWLEAASPF